MANLAATVETDLGYVHSLELHDVEPCSYKFKTVKQA